MCNSVICKSWKSSVLKVLIFLSEILQSSFSLIVIIDIIKLHYIFNMLKPPTFVNRDESILS